MKASSIISTLLKVCVLSALSITPLHADKKSSLDETSFQVILTNGDQLDSQFPISIKSRSLSIQEKTSQIPISDLLTITLKGNIPPSSVKNTAFIKLEKRFDESQNDLIIGDLQQLTADKVIIKTEFSEELSINRSMVHSFEIKQQGKDCYYGPNNTGEWTARPNNPQWAYHNGALKSKLSSSISKKVALASKFHMSFQISNQESQRVLIKFSADHPLPVHPKTGYCLQFTSRYINYNGYGEKNQKNNTFIVKSHLVKWGEPNKKSTIDIFVNTDEGIMLLYVNKKQLFTEKMLITETLGEYMCLESSENFPVSIQNIAITPWSGLEPSIILAAPETASKAITLNNGDVVSGDVSQVSDDAVLIETKYKPIHIPLRKIKSFSLGTSSHQPIMKTDDVRVYLKNGSIIVLKLSEITDSYLAGYGQALGDIQITLDTIHHIDFNIYDYSLQTSRLMTH